MLETKPIYFGNEAKYIVMQKQGGNCPLIALINYRCLLDQIEIPNSVSEEDLLSIAVGLYPEHTELIFNYSDQLLRGTFVDPKFSSIYEFQECLLLKFGVRVVHGWVLDPLDPLSKKLISYNQAAALITTESDDDAKDFLKSNQLSVNGLQMLYELEPTPWLGIFFRNNHFNVLYKRGNQELFQLVTDEGFRNTSITWETVTLDGDSLYYDSDFHLREPSAANLLHCDSTPSSEQLQDPSMSSQSPSQSQSQLTPNLRRKHNNREKSCVIQ
eukprot:NODE_391_length_8148_cov_0.393838.p4 type:complete len:271 gc:universal NODE_391_length_8148_cov_0.393838:7857-7045(-)